MEIPLNSFFFHEYFRWFQAGSWWISSWCWCTLLFVKASSTNLDSPRILLLITGPSLKEDVSNSYMDFTSSIKKWVIKRNITFLVSSMSRRRRGPKRWLWILEEAGLLCTRSSIRQFYGGHMPGLVWNVWRFVLLTRTRKAIQGRPSEDRSDKPSVATQFTHTIIPSVICSWMCSGLDLHYGI